MCKLWGITHKLNKVQALFQVFSDSPELLIDKIHKNNDLFLIFGNPNVTDASKLSIFYDDGRKIDPTRSCFGLY